MPSHSVKLILQNGSCTYITARSARRLQDALKVCLVSKSPFVLRMKEGAMEFTQWTAVSGGMRMNGSILMKKPLLWGHERKKSKR